jgi:molecular chaperone GrpE (heat shock protein)
MIRSTPYRREKRLTLQNKGGEVLDGKEAIEQFKEWYMESYGVKPTEKLIETFCKMKGIDIEKVMEQDRKEVVKVEEPKDYEACSILKDIPTVATADSHIPYSEANFRALDTNYQNLLAEFQEISAIAQEQRKTIEDDNALIVKLSTNIGKLLNILDYYEDFLSPSDKGKLGEIKKEVGLP